MPAKSSSSWYANHLNNLVRLIVTILLIALAIEAYRYLFKDIITGKSHFFAFLAIWLITAYLVLPRLYRFFSKYFLPDYFIGRTQAGDGLLADPINLAFNTTRDNLIKSMELSGWTMASPLSLTSSLKMIYSAVAGRQYSDAPVSSLFLFSRKQDLAFERDLDGNPRKRHHIRFWKTPKNWWLPGGYQADWLAAATFDKNVGLSLFTGQITHKIDSNIDKERDFVIDSLKNAVTVIDVKHVKHFTSSYHSRSSGGDVIHTDGSLPFVTI